MPRFFKTFCLIFAAFIFSLSSYIPSSYAATTTKTTQKKKVVPKKGQKVTQRRATNTRAAKGRQARGRVAQTAKGRTPKATTRRGSNYKTTSRRYKKSRWRAHGKKRARWKRARPVIRHSAGDLAGLANTPDPLSLRSNAALVIDKDTLEVIYEKNPGYPLPMASITKLMTALVVVESGQDMNEILEITQADVDYLKHTRSRLRVGTRLSRADMLHLALMSSENRAAAALGRNYPGGITAFVQAMNTKAKILGMEDTHYEDTSGLSSSNVASAIDLAKLAMAASEHDIIKRFSTDSNYTIHDGTHQIHYNTTNRLVRESDWQVNLQKTGYISAAGRCLLMETVVDQKPVVMVFLDSKGKTSRISDAQRMKNWLLNPNDIAPAEPITESYSSSSDDEYDAIQEIINNN